jgi:hypothetical protein
MRRPTPIEVEFAILLTLIGVPLAWVVLQTIFAAARMIFSG